MSFSRREFSKDVRREAHARSGGICECYRIVGVPGLIPGGCGQPLGTGNTFYEHIICDGIGGDPTLENCAVLTKTCWRIKTDTYDRPIVAKSNRQHDREICIGRADGPPMPGSKRSSVKHLLNGKRGRDAWERRA